MYVERLGREALAGQHVRDAGRVGGERLRGDAADRIGGRHDLLRAEEGLARGHHELAPGRRRRELLVRPPRPAAPRPCRRPGAARRSAASPPGRRARPCRTRRPSRSRRRARGGRRSARAPAGQARSRSRWCRARRWRAAAGRSRTPRARRRAARRAPRARGSRAPPARTRRSAASVSPSSSRPLHRRAAAGGVERAEQQRVRAGRLDQGHAAVDDALLDQAVVTEVDHRRLREAADDLVDARDDEVGAERERVPRQVLVEGAGGRPRPRRRPAGRRAACATSASPAMSATAPK